MSWEGATQPFSPIFSSDSPLLLSFSFHTSSCVLWRVGQRGISGSVFRKFFLPVATGSEDSVVFHWLPWLSTHFLLGGLLFFPFTPPVISPRVLLAASFISLYSLSASSALLSWPSLAPFLYLWLLPLRFSLFPASPGSPPLENCSEQTSPKLGSHCSPYIKLLLILGSKQWCPLLPPACPDTPSFLPNLGSAQASYLISASPGCPVPSFLPLLCSSSPFSSPRLSKYPSDKSHNFPAGMILKCSSSKTFSDFSLLWC